jgi:uncharacterized membrane protein
MYAIRVRDRFRKHEGGQNTMTNEAHQLVAIVYPDEFKAAEVRAVLVRLQKEYLLDIDDSAYVTKDSSGKLTMHQDHELTAIGAAGGAFWGLLFGLLFFVPLAGMAIGAGLGALVGHFSNYGIDGNFVKSLTEGMTPDSSALFVLVRNVNQERVVPEIARYGGTVLRTSLTPDAEQQLQAALSAGQAASSQPASPAKEAGEPGTAGSVSPGA